MILAISQQGFETLMAAEIAPPGLLREKGPGWALAEVPLSGDWAFPQGVLDQPIEVKGESVNSLANAIAAHFLEGLRGVRIESEWPCLFTGPSEMVGLGRRMGAVESAVLELLKRKLNRVAKLASPSVAKGVGPVQGLFVHFVDFGRAFVARSYLRNGARRMSDDDLAPSRSYLKVEEAYGILGAEPAAGEVVCDLGAAPGGWSYSAARRGARVIAVDNGPLKGGALDNPLIEHRREDAFGFVPPGGTCDWLFCDMVEEPHHILRSIVAPWLEAPRCRAFVVNLKFGRVDPIALLREVRDPSSVLSRRAPGFRIRHLWHDREEFTVVGRLAP